MSEITGYRELTADDVNVINAIKQVEGDVAAMWSHLSETHTGIDRRWCAVAKTHFQEGFTALVRAIARPADPFDKEN